MAEDGIHAFGRYLRTLRERCKLSLQEVCSLSQAFAETLNKGYLSRCENGRQRLAMPKVIPLSRIYGVSADVLLERLELDLELDRVGGPDTEGLSFAELTKAGADAANQGFRWNAYGYLRDAVPRAQVDSPTSAFADRDEQVACAHLSCATAGRGLGRLKFAMHELLYVESSERIGRRFRPILFERMSVTYRESNEVAVAREYAEKAVTASEKIGHHDYLGYVYGNRASQALADSDLELSAEYYQKAYDAFRSLGLESECARSLNNLAQVYFDLGRLRASRRALLAADKLALPMGESRQRALSRILMGEIDVLEGNDPLAEKRWREALEIAKRLNDKTLRFKAEYLLLKLATKNDDLPVARAIQRRLSKLAQWVPKTIPELQEFEQSVPTSSSKRVS